MARLAWRGSPTYPQTNTSSIERGEGASLLHIFWTFIGILHCGPSLRTIPLLVWFFKNPVPAVVPYTPHQIMVTTIGVCE